MNKDRFLEAVGDAFFERRKDIMAHRDDEIVLAIKRLNLKPDRVLEIGCADGWRLKMIQEEFESVAYGIDPSSNAIKSSNGSFPRLIQGTADDLPYEDAFFDCVIFGHCLYACDRKDLFKIAYQADRVLREGGHMVVMDFYPPFPQHNVLPDDHDIFSYKMDYTSMFAWSPCYHLTYRNIFIQPFSRCWDQVFVVVFEKVNVK